MPICISCILSTLFEGTEICRSTFFSKFFALLLVNKIILILFLLAKSNVFKIFLLFPEVVIANKTSPFEPIDSICLKNILSKP